MRRRIAILISGRGSNMLSLLKLRHQPDFAGEFALVLSNKGDAGGLVAAADAGIATEVIDHRQYPDRESFDRAMDTTLAAHGVDLVVLAGFMRILSSWFTERWQGRLINIHPSLLPAFRGVHTHRRALEAGVRIHGCSVHFVIPELDAGPIIAQAAVPVLPGDTEETLATRVLKQEHVIYPIALKMLCSGLVSLDDDGRVVFAPGIGDNGEKALLSPDSRA